MFVVARLAAWSGQNIVARRTAQGEGHKCVAEIYDAVDVAIGAFCASVCRNILMQRVKVAFGKRCEYDFQTFLRTF